MKYLLAAVLLFLPGLMFAQTGSVPVSPKKTEKAIDELAAFKKKLQLAVEWVQTQPFAVLAEKIRGKEFRANATDANIYTLADAENDTLFVYLHRQTLRIAYIELRENIHLEQKIRTYLMESDTYNWIGSEHLCDYFNNRSHTLRLCPGTEKGLQIAVSRITD